MFRINIEKSSGYNIPCIADISNSCQIIIIIVHGIFSSKESEDIHNLMDFFSERNFGIIAYDQPGHGKEMALDEPLGLDSCLSSLYDVERYLLKMYPTKKICYFASSFGGYVLGIYITKNLNTGKKAFMRSSAICFSQILFKYINSMNNNSVDVYSNSFKGLEISGSGSAIIITKRFLNELKKNDLIELYSVDYPYSVDICFVHGELDNIVPVEVVKEFASKYGYPIIIFKNEGHQLKKFFKKNRVSLV